MWGGQERYGVGLFYLLIFSLNSKSGKCSSSNETRISDFALTAVVDQNE